MNFQDNSYLENIGDSEKFNLEVRSGEFDGKSVKIELKGEYTLDMSGDYNLDDLEMDIYLDGEISETLEENDAYAFLSKL